MPRFLLPLALLFAAPLSATEFPISEPDVVPFERGVIAGGAPTIAAGDDGFLVVWHSNTFPGGRPSPGPTWVRAYDSNGPRVPVATPIFSGAGSFAVWTGSEYLVIRTPQFMAFAALLPSPVIEVSRVDAAGREIAASKVSLQLGTRAGYVHGFAWDGAYAAALVRFFGAPMFSVLLFDREGRFVAETPLTGEPSAIAARRGGGFFILQQAQGDAVAQGGLWFGAIDNTEEGVIARILDGSGAELDRFVVSAAGTGARSIAWTGSEWITMFRGEGDQLCTARFKRASDVRTECFSRPGADAPFIAAGPAGVLRAWWEPGGQVVTEKGLATTVYSRAGLPAAAVDDTGLLAAWSEDTDAGDRIHLGGRANDGTPRPEVVLPGDQRQTEPRLSRSGGQTLLVWVEGTRVRAVRVDAAGQLVAPAVELSGDYADSPAIAAREGAWLVAWRKGDAIETRLVSAAITLSEIERFVSPPIAESPALAATSDGWLLVWGEVSAQTRILGQRLDAAGNPVGERLVLSALGGKYPAIACNDDACLVTWLDETGLHAKTVRHDGSEASAPRRISPVTSGRPPVILVLRDGSFQVHQEGSILYLDRDGALRDALHWGNTFTIFGDAVIWNGRVTMVSMQSAFMPDGFVATRVTAFQFPPRLRSVRH